MKKIIFSLVFLVIISLNDVFGQVCYDISHEGSVVTVSVEATGDYSNAPACIWTVASITLSWSNTLGTDIVDSFAGMNSFPFSQDGPPEVVGGMVYQKAGFSGQSLNISIPAGTSMDVFQMNVSHPSISIGDFNIEETPPIQNGESGFLNVFANQFTPGTCNLTAASVALPLELVNFNAVLKNEDVLVNWSTLFEENIDYYEVEKSEDARSWTQIGQVETQGDSEDLTNYFFTDNAAFKGTNVRDLYYRLKIMEKDGVFSYSSVKRVTIEEEVDIIFYPNPAQGTVFMKTQTERPETGTINIYDQTGRLLSQQEFSTDTGSNSTPISVKNFAGGAYFTKVILEERVFNHWIVVAD